MATFKDLTIASDILEALDKLGFTEPTEIQKKAIPLLLSSDKIDFHGQAQTGTGKTLAFGIPLLQKIDRTKLVPQALVVAPTRELAVQIYESLRSTASHVGIKMVVIYGGMSIEDQMATLRRGVHVVIGTPGRLNDHLRRGTLKVDAVKVLVLDEADIMLDMGFKDEIDEILEYVPDDRAIWLFSATVKPGIEKLKAAYMQEPVSVRVSQKQVGTEQTKQYYCIMPFKYRLHAVTRFIQSVPDFYGFIFCQTKILTAEVAEQLIKRGYNVGALHGDMSQAQRNLVIRKFRNKEITIVVATDVAARGIDVPDLTHVINYSLPEDLESYVHRIGRTGRAGKEGTAITFVTKSELRTIHHLERQFTVAIRPIEVPSTEDLVQARLHEIRDYLTAAAHTKQQVGYGEQLKELIQLFNKQDLESITVKLLYDKFLATLDLEEVPSIKEVDTEQEIQELSITIGSDDGADRALIEQFVIQSGKITQAQIRSVRVLKRRSFVKLTGDCSPELLHALRGKTLLGRSVRINFTCVISDGPGGFRSGGGDRQGRQQRSGRRKPTYRKQGRKRT